ncbi:MAG: hypothetical protein ACJ76Z_15530 [Thermoleophilaceae bacterium]
MRSKITKKRITALLGVVAALAVAVGAVAYWTAGGSGSGTGTNVSTTSSLGLTANGLGGLTPSGSKSFSVDFTNPNSYAVRVSSVLIDDRYGDGITGGAEGTNAAHGGNGITTSDAGCLSSWFATNASTGSFALGSAVTVPANNGTTDGSATASSVGTVSMPTNTTDNQNVCKGVTLTLHLKS